MIRNDTFMALQQLSPFVLVLYLTALQQSCSHPTLLFREMYWGQSKNAKARRVSSAGDGADGKQEGANQVFSYGRT